MRRTISTAAGVIALIVLSCSSLACAQPMTTRPWSGEQALAAVERAARAGDVAAHSQLARTFAQSDPARSIEHWGAASALPDSGAVAALRPLAESGNARASYFLARALLSSPEGDRGEGLRWLRAAADRGEADAAFSLGCLLIGSTDAADRSEAARRFQEAARANPGLASLARVIVRQVRGRTAPWQPRPGGRVTYLYDFGRTREHETAGLAYWGLTQAQSTDPQTLERIFERQGRFAELADAAHVNDSVALVAMRTLLMNHCSDGRRMDREACTAFFNLDLRTLPADTASALHSGALMRDALGVGRMFELGVGGPIDYALAQQAYVRAIWAANSDSSAAAKSAAADANFRLYNLIKDGRLSGTPEAAAEYLRSASHLGSPLADYVLALDMIRAGRADDTTYLLRSAADAGNADAAYRYATILSQRPMLTDEHRVHIHQYFRLAAENNVLAGFDGVARSYWNGWGVPVSQAQAEEWWERAGRAGDHNASLIVGLLHQNRQDHAGAIPWLRRAAAGGVPTAAERLRQVQDAGYREQNFGNFLMQVLEAGGEVLAGMEEARQHQIALVDAEIRRSMSFYVLPGPDVEGEARYAADLAELERERQAMEARHAEDREALAGANTYGARDDGRTSGSAGERSEAEQQARDDEQRQAQEARQLEVERERREAAQRARDEQQRRREQAEQEERERQAQAARDAEARRQEQQRQREAAEAARTRVIDFKEAVVLCELSGAQAQFGNWRCEGPLQMNYVNLSRGDYASAFAQMDCSNFRELPRAGVYRAFGCGYGLHPTNPGAARNVPEMLGVFVDGRVSFRCPRNISGVCRSR